MVVLAHFDHDVVMENTTNPNTGTTTHADGGMHNNAPGMATSTPLVRDPNGLIGGVLTGLARQQGWDVSLVRFVGVILLLTTWGTAVALYLAAWLIIPKANNGFHANPAMVNAPSPQDVVAA